VDNIVRAMPLLLEETKKLKNIENDILKDMIKRFDNKVNLGKSLSYIIKRLEKDSVIRVNAQ
jgi:phosphopantothenate synthetase